MIPCREIFGEYLNQSLAEAFENSLIKIVELNMDKRLLVIALKSTK